MQAFQEALGAASIGREFRADYRKWLRFYLDFCGKYGHPATSSVPLFMAKLAEKNQSEAQRRQASEAVGLYLGLSSREPGVRAAAVASDSARERGVAGRSQPEGGRAPGRADAGKRAPRSLDRSRVVEDRGFAGGGTVRESASDFGKARGAHTPGSPGTVVNAFRDVDADDSSNRGAHGRPERERSGRAVSWAAQYEEGGGGEGWGGGGGGGGGGGEGRGGRGRWWGRVFFRVRLQFRRDVKSIGSHLVNMLLTPEAR